MQARTPYDVKVDVLVGWSRDGQGAVFVRVHTRATRASEWEVAEYVSTWVKDDDEWAFDDMAETSCMDRALHEFPHIDAAPN